MPGYLLSLVSQVQCAHGGQAKPAMPNARVLVGGQPVVNVSSPYLIAGCTLPPPTAGNGPCVTGQFTTSSTRVMAGGLPVLLIDSIGVCAPTGTPLQAVVTQVRVSGS
jgi:hypothetical protein